MLINTTIRVWIRALGSSCRIRVENEKNARWVLERLTERKVLEGLDQIEIQPTDGGCRFQIPNASQRTLAALETALGQIPEVHLMLSPEDAEKPGK